MNSKSHISILFLILSQLFINPICFGKISSSKNTIDISEKWTVELQDIPGRHVISLPGTTDDAGLGIPDSLTPQLRKPQLLHLTRKNRFVGTAKYTKDINIPGSMADKPLRLILGRVMWGSKLFIDDKQIGIPNESLTTPHVFIINNGLKEGAHKITLEIDNSRLYDISVNNLAHSYTDDTQIMWNGILGDMIIEAIPEIEISNIKIYPDIKESMIKVEAILSSNLKKAKNCQLKYQLSGIPGEPISRSMPIHVKPGSETISFSINEKRFSDCLWSEFSPNLLEIQLSLDKWKNVKTQTFGMREFKSDKNNLSINGEPLFLRGTLECCIFPLTGYPPMDEKGWEKVFLTAKEWGLNHLRFHSWCPPDAAFRVADRLGFYLQIECPLWETSISSDSIGRNGERKRFIREEFERISDTYGNHPSFCMMTVGNELQSDFDWINRMVSHMREYDPRHLYAATSFTFGKNHGGHAEPFDQFIVTQWTDDGWVRGQGIFDEEAPAFDRNYFSATRNLTVPLVSHEIGQYAVYPDLAEIEKYTGVLDPLNFKAIKEDLISKGRLHKAPEYLKASGKLAEILYKEELERALKTPGCSGIQLLGLQDFPGQGTALVGLVNAFWESKGITDPDRFRQYCSPTVPLLYFPKAVYTDKDTFTAKIELANYQRVNLDSIETLWRIKDKSIIMGEGKFINTDLRNGNNQIGSISLPLTEITKPSQLEIEVIVPHLGASNSWNIWVYPEKSIRSCKDELFAKNHPDFLITDSLEDAISALDQGKNVIFSPSPQNIDGSKSKFVPVFWSPVHFPKEAGGMGILCDPEHPAFSEFPNDGHTDWQWWHLIKNSKTLDLTEIEKDVFPIVEMVDNFTTNRPLSLLFETRCSKGKLLFSTMDLLSDDALEDPATGALLHSLINYISSQEFNPSTTLSVSNLRKLVSPLSEK